MRPLICASLLLLVWFGRVSFAAPARVPNVLMVLVEGVGFSDWGCFGGEVATPYLDWLAENGLRFSQAYRGGSVPETEDAVLTGYFPGHLRIEAGGRPPAVFGRTLSNFLEEAGYRIYSREAVLRHREPVKGGGREIEEGWEVEEFLTAHAREAAESPFFCMVNLSVGEFGKDLKFGRGDSSGGLEGGIEGVWKQRWERVQETIGGGIGGGVDVLSGAGKLGGDFRREMGERWAWAERVDVWVGRWLEQIKTMGAMENTVVVILGAGGEFKGGLTNGVGGCPLRWSKHGVHEASLGSPMIWFGPGLGKAIGQWRAQPVHVADLAPTLLRMVGLSWSKAAVPATQPALDGVDLSAVLREDRPIVGRALWWQRGDDRVFRLGDWKWISIRGQPPELYYLKADRSESVNLAEANYERISEMEAQWKRLSDRFAREAGRGVDSTLNHPPPATGR